ncbi:MAG: hypothetical protein MZW92_56605 [Comamonadaceae bacterium]|nr:hypothetical protein [Comamonadaceae bacterium]
MHVSALRRKLGRELIETVRGLGYRIDAARGMTQRAAVDPRAAGQCAAGLVAGLGRGRVGWRSGWRRSTKSTNCSTRRCNPRPSCCGACAGRSRRPAAVARRATAVLPQATATASSPGSWWAADGRGAAALGATRPTIALLPAGQRPASVRPATGACSACRQRGQRRPHALRRADQRAERARGAARGGAEPQRWRRWRSGCSGVCGCARACARSCSRCERLPGAPERATIRWTAQPRPGRRRARRAGAGAHGDRRPGPCAWRGAWRTSGAFTAHAAHALRTPLAGIDAQLAVALRESPPGAAAAAAARARRRRRACSAWCGAARRCSAAAATLSRQRDRPAGAAGASAAGRGPAGAVADDGAPSSRRRPAGRRAAQPAGQRPCATARATLARAGRAGRPRCGCDDDGPGAARAERRAQLRAALDDARATKAAPAWA